VEVMRSALLDCKSITAFMREGYAGRWDDAAKMVGLTVESAKQQHMTLRMVAALIGRNDEKLIKADIAVRSENIPVPSEIVMPNTLERACREAGISIEDVKSEKRTNSIAHRRWHVMWIMRQAGMSLPEIGRRLGGKDHSTVHNGIRQYQKRLLAGMAAE
jgi:chromosomal replication initiation ATPase DnaA